MFSGLLMLLVLVAVSLVAVLFKVALVSIVIQIVTLALIVFLIFRVRIKIASREKEKMIEKVNELERKIESMVEKG